MKTTTRAGALLMMCALVICPLTAAAEDTGCAEDDAKCWIGALEEEGADSMQAAMALGRLQAATAIPVLIKTFESKDEYLATMAVHSLVKIGSPAVPALVEATQSSGANTRKYSIYALGRIGDGSVVMAVAKLAVDPDKDVRINAARSLGRLKNKSGLLVLNHMLQDKSRTVRIEAIRAIGELPDVKEIPFLVDKGLLDLDSQVAVEAAAVLLKIGPGCASYILDKYGSGPDYAKGRMCAVLGQLWAVETPGMKKRIEDALIRILAAKNESMKVRQSACVGLGSIGGPKAVAALKKAIKENTGKKKSADLLKAAQNALSRIQSSTK